MSRTLRSPSWWKPSAGPRWRWISLQAGKSVITSNKELVAEHGCELLRLAQEKGVSYLFEASVGGGIPIIRP